MDSTTPLLSALTNFIGELKTISKGDVKDLEILLPDNLYGEYLERELQQFFRDKHLEYKFLPKDEQLIQHENNKTYFYIHGVKFTLSSKEFNKRILRSKLDRFLQELNN